MEYQTPQTLNFVKIHQNINDLPSKYPELFKGIGKLKDTQVKIHLDDSINTMAQKPRRAFFESKLNRNRETATGRH